TWFHQSTHTNIWRSNYHIGIWNNDCLPTFLQTTTQPAGPHTYLELLATSISGVLATSPCLFSSCSFPALFVTATTLKMPSCMKCTTFVNQLHFGWCNNCLEEVGLNDQASTPVASTSLTLWMAEPANCAGTQAYFRDVGKAKRTKTPTPSPYARRPAPPPPPIEDQIKIVNCGIGFYQLDKPKRNGIMCCMLQVNVLQPNWYLSLQQQLWELFSLSLVSKNLVESLPQDFLPYTNLSHKQNVIDSETLVILLEQSTIKKPVQIDITYQETLHVSENNNTDDVSSNLPTANDPHTPSVPASNAPLPETPTPRLTRSAALANTRSGALAHGANTPLATAIQGTDARWALGGVAAASLSTHMNYLGRPVSAGMINLNLEGWVVAQRLKFNHNNSGGQQSAYQARYQHLKASTLPLTIKVNKTTIVCQDSISMRKAYSALVKTNGQNGVRVHDEYPSINLHATDTCMYEACGHLLRAFHVVISHSTSHVLNDGIRQKIKTFDVSPANMPPCGDIPAPGRFVQSVIACTTTRTVIPPH
ncbi:hypothetical protein PSHT_10850, partial [Puccinia striiformis]